MEFEYDEILNMLVSNDEESRNLAMIGLENLDFDKYCIRILWLKKDSNIDIDIWRMVTPTLAQNMRRIMNQAGKSIDEPITAVILYDVLSSLKTPLFDKEDRVFTLTKLFSTLTTHKQMKTKYPDLDKQVKIILVDE